MGGGNKRIVDSAPQSWPGLDGRPQPSQRSIPISKKLRSLEASCEHPCGEVAHQFLGRARNHVNVTNATIRFMSILIDRQYKSCAFGSAQAALGLGSLGEGLSDPWQHIGVAARK
jgi:hypothetical protein